MSAAIDTRANVERPAEDRPVRIAPPVPDRESEAPYWHGPASARAIAWRTRALAAEAEVVLLRKALARWRFRP